MKKKESESAERQPANLCFPTALASRCRLSHPGVAGAAAVASGTTRLELSSWVVTCKAYEHEIHQRDESPSLNVHFTLSTGHVCLPAFL